MKGLVRFGCGESKMEIRCGLGPVSPCRETWMVLGSPKGNPDPVASTPAAQRERQSPQMQAASTAADPCATHCLPCPSALPFCTVALFQRWSCGGDLSGCVTKGKRARLLILLGKCFNTSLSRRRVRTSCPAAPWPRDRTTAGFSKEVSSHKLTLGRLTS